MTRDQIIEVMARAVPTYQTHPALAVAEISAAYDALTSAGLAVVPVEPTDAMLKAGIDHRLNVALTNWPDDTKSLYRAMIEKA